MLNRQRLRFLLSLCLVGLLTVTLVSCDSDGGNEDTGPTFQNNFSFEVTEGSSSSTTVEGDRTTLEGFSFFFTGTDPESGDEIFVVYFTEEDEIGEASAQQDLFGFLVRERLRPRTGTYNLVSFESDPDLQTDMGMMLIQNIGEFGMEGGSYGWYLGEAGTVEVTRSSDDRVDATIRADAKRVSFSETTVDTTQVEVTGQFSAQGAESFVGFSPFAP